MPLVLLPPSRLPRPPAAVVDPPAGAALLRLPSSVLEAEVLLALEYDKAIELGIDFVPSSMQATICVYCGQCAAGFRKENDEQSQKCVHLCELDVIFVVGKQWLYFFDDDRVVCRQMIREMMMVNPPP